MGNQSDAVALYDYALEIEPDNPKILYFKGVALSRQEHYEDAIDTLNMPFLMNLKMLPDIIILVWHMPERSDILMR